MYDTISHFTEHVTNQVHHTGSIDHKFHIESYEIFKQG